MRRELPSKKPQNFMLQSKGRQRRQPSLQLPRRPQLLGLVLPHVGTPPGESKWPPGLSACKKEPVEAPLACASLWDVPDPDGPLDVISVLNFKGTPPSTLANWADYHLLHGVQHMVFVDNNCGVEQVKYADDVLKQYVERGLATIVETFRCSKWDEPGLKAGGAPTMRFRALKELTALHARMHPETLVLSLDDDEFLVMPDATASAVTIATQMQQHGLCAATLGWRTFGEIGRASCRERV